jgi:hypothetical protein
LEEFYITEEKKEKEGTVIIWLKREWIINNYQELRLLFY